MTTASDPTIVRLIHEARHGALATLEADGAPYASLVALAPDVDGIPVLFLSELARHTRNITRVSQASLLVTASSADPLAAPRASLLGRVVPTELPSARARFLAFHPDSALYADFSDFSFYRLEVEEVHLVEGFGRIATRPGAAALPPTCPALAAAETDIVAHMNGEHQDAVQLYAKGLLKETGEGWRILALDSAGCDLTDGTRIRRLDFPAPALSVAAVRDVFVALANSARK